MIQIASCADVGNKLIYLCSLMHECELQYIFDPTNAVGCGFPVWSCEPCKDELATEIPFIRPTFLVLNSLNVSLRLNYCKWLTDAVNFSFLDSPYMPSLIVQ